MEKKEVSIKIKTIQSTDGQREIVGGEYPGIAESNGDQIIVRYSSSDENGECEYEIIMSPRGCAVATSGAIERLIKYEMGKRNDCSMRIFAGIIPMECSTNEYVYEDKWEKIGRARARINYDLFSGKELLSHQVMNIIVKAR